MKTETEAFNEFDDHLKLDPEERDRASECHRAIGALLNREGYTTGTFLQGSFRRKTMIRPLRDIDMVVLLDDRMRDYLGDIVRRGIRSGVRGGPRRVMELLRPVLQAEYPAAKIDDGKHALTIDFGGGGFKFDVVPAFDSGEGEHGDVFIANTTTEVWERSNTRELIRVVAKRNQACGGWFIHQVRMLKHAVTNNSSLGDEFFGLLSESIAFAGIREELQHGEALLEAISAGVELLRGGTILDPTGEDNLARKLTPDVHVAASMLFEGWLRHALQARRSADGGDHESAIASWQRVFGDAFPSAAKQTEVEAATAWQGGAPTHAGRVSAVAGGPVAPPSRSWRSR